MGAVVIGPEVDGADTLPVAGMSVAAVFVGGAEVDATLRVTGMVVAADAVELGVPGRAAPGELSLRPMRKPTATKISVEITPTATQTICRTGGPWLRENRAPTVGTGPPGADSGGGGGGGGGGRSGAMRSAYCRAPTVTIDNLALLHFCTMNFPSTREFNPCNGYLSTADSWRRIATGWRLRSRFPRRGAGSVLSR